MGRITQVTAYQMKQLGTSFFS